VDAASWERRPLRSTLLDPISALRPRDSQHTMAPSTLPQRSLVADVELISARSVAQFTVRLHFPAEAQRRPEDVCRSWDEWLELCVRVHVQRVLTREAIDCSPTAPKRPTSCRACRVAARSSSPRPSSRRAAKTSSAGASTRCCSRG